MNGFTADTHIVAVTPWWQIALIALDVVLGGRDGVFIVKLVLAVRKRRPSRRSKRKEALVLAAQAANCEAPKKSQKQSGGKAPERRRPLWTPSDGNAANGLFLIDFCGKVSLCALR